MSEHITKPADQATDAKGRLRALAHHMSSPAPAQGGDHPHIDDWDSASAEALMQAYEGQTPTVYYADPPTSPAHRRIPSSAMEHRPTTKPAVPATAQVMPASPDVTLADLSQDRVWLEGRFSALAARLEETMHRLDPADQIAPLTGRIDGLELQLRSALDGVVPHEAFASLETQIGDVRRQLETARGKLDRLDGIEAKLEALAELAVAASEPPHGGAPRHADLDIAALLNSAVDQTAQRLAREARPAFDIDALVDRTAVRTAERIAAAPVRSGPAEGVSELRSMVAGYVDEYRREQSQTAAALATMQEALVSLIDRIDQYDDDVVHGGLPGEIETEPAPAAVVPPQPPVRDTSPDQFVEVPDERGTRPGRRAADLSLAMPTVLVPHAEALGTRRVPAAGPAPELSADVASAAEALAAERVRVAAERAAHAPGGQNGMRRPARTPDPLLPNCEPKAEAEETAQQTPKPRATRKVAAGGTNARRGLMVAGIAAVVIGASATAHMFLSGRFSAAPKMEERVPVSSGAKLTPRPPTVAGPSLTQPAVSGPSTPLPIVPATPPAGSADPTRNLTPSGAVGPADSRLLPVPARVPPVQPAPQQQPAPQPAPAPASSALPDGFKPRSVPETVNDDLQSDARPALGGVRVSSAAVSGITLDSGGMQSPADLARRLGTPTGTATPADASTIIEPPRNGRIEMPPATVGPSSLRTAAQQGDPGAQFEVAARFAEGKGLKQDFQQAIAWYSRAAQSGFVPAQYRLATLYERGLGTPSDVTRAKVWYRRAADQGHVKSMHNLAVLAAGPQQAEPDYPTAARWFTEAADRGLADSQFNLGVLAENGLGMPKDTAHAFKWFALAARSGDKEATRRRDQLAATFTPEQARSAEQLVTAWRAKPTEMKANDPRSASQAFAAEREAAAQAAQRQAEQREAAQPAAPMPPPPAATAPKAKPAKVSARTP